jgi:hypothetical protein
MDALGTLAPLSNQPELLAACIAAESLLTKQLAEYNAAGSVIPDNACEPGPVLTVLRSALAKAKGGAA